MNKKWFQEGKNQEICSYCGVITTQLTADHIVPLAQGGTNDRYNIVFCCNDCNQKKGSKPLNAFLLERQSEVQR